MKYEYSSDFAKLVIPKKYCFPEEKGDFDLAIKRVAENVNKYDKLKKDEMIQKTIEYITKQEFSFAGGVWRAAGNSKTNVSHVNCTTQERVKDSIDDIFGNSIKYWAKIASYGQGNGIDITGLRPRGAYVQNTAQSSTGAVSFLTCYDASMQVIGAENRRGATKPDIHSRHPDAQEYTQCKKDITKLTSQNISIKVDDAFMEAVKTNNTYVQKWERKNGVVKVGEMVYDENSPGKDILVEKEINASDLFEEIVKAAWETGEPGIEFWDTSERLSNSNFHPDKKYHVVSTNGCSEQKLDAWNTCILASINLAKMPKFHEDWASWLEERTRYGIRALDNVIDCEYIENRSPHPQQREKLRSMPRIGLGFTGLADYFINNGVIYASKESIQMLDSILKIFAQAAYRESISLGKERGSFTEFSPEWYTKSTFIRQLCENTNLKIEEFTHMRHVCLLSIAPTGTLSFVVGAGGSGCEPLAAPWMYRKERATTGEYIERYIFDTCLLNKFKENGLEPNISNAKSITSSSAWVFSISDGNDNTKIVNSIDKIDLMSIIYKYIDSGVSVTYNLPKTATIQDVKDIYFKAWEKGLKSVTVYRDGCREGIINIESKQEILKKHDAIKRPKELKCDIHHLKVQGEKWTVVVGLLNNEPYEIFCGLEKDKKVPSGSGIIKKVKRGKYVILIEDQEFDFKETFDNRPDQSALSRAHSLSLRHGVDIKYVVEQMEKTEGDMTTFAKAMSRVLKKYIKDGTVISGSSCGACNSNNMIRQAGCITCGDCGWSKC